MLISTLYTGPLKQAVVNLATTQNQGRLLNAIIASAPFVERVGERFGADAGGVMGALRSIVEPRQITELQVKGAVPGADPGKMTPAQFNEWVKTFKQ
jgi:hypothetical protein